MGVDLESLGFTEDDLFQRELSVITLTQMKVGNNLYVEVFEASFAMLLHKISDLPMSTNCVYFVQEFGRIIEDFLLHYLIISPPFFMPTDSAIAGAYTYMLKSFVGLYKKPGDKNLEEL